MKVSIGDMDYYYNPTKRNAFDPDAMKISSYHKQLGDKINFVTKQDDIHRPYDLYYIIKEKTTTPNPPPVFFLDKNVRGWGKAFKMRINGHMSDAMLGCRPDYLLYPEHNTGDERAEHIRLFNNKGEPLQGIQNGSNTFTRKKVFVTDPYFGCANKNNILQALEKLSMLQKVTFLEPIWIQKLIYDKDIRQAFYKLHFLDGVNLHWSPINLDQGSAARDMGLEMSHEIPHIQFEPLTIDYRNHSEDHGTSPDKALSDYLNLQKVIIESKRAEFKIFIRMPATRLETPYFEIFENLSTGTKYYFQYSGLEYITMMYGPKDRAQGSEYGNTPSMGHEVFRDLLRQSYIYPEFLTLKGKNQSVSTNDIPGNKGNKEFIYGI